MGMKVSTGARIASMQSQFLQKLDERDRRIQVQERANIALQGAFHLFTKNHYIAVAKIIRDERVKLSNLKGIDPVVDADVYAKREQINELQLAFIRKFESENRDFNKLLFIGACGGQGDGVS